MSGLEVTRSVDKETQSIFLSVLYPIVPCFSSKNDNISLCRDKSHHALFILFALRSEFCSSEPRNVTAVGVRPRRSGVIKIRTVLFPSAPFPTPILKSEQLRAASQG